MWTPTFRFTIGRMSCSTQCHSAFGWSGVTAWRPRCPQWMNSRGQVAQDPATGELIVGGCHGADRTDLQELGGRAPRRWQDLRRRDQGECVSDRSARLRADERGLRAVLRAAVSRTNHDRRRDPSLGRGGRDRRGGAVRGAAGRADVLYLI